MLLGRNSIIFLSVGIEDSIFPLILLWTLTFLFHFFNINIFILLLRISLFVDLARRRFLLIWQKFFEETENFTFAQFLLILICIFRNLYITLLVNNRKQMDRNLVQRLYFEEWMLMRSFILTFLAQIILITNHTSEPHTFQRHFGTLKAWNSLKNNRFHYYFVLGTLLLKDLEFLADLRLTGTVLRPAVNRWSIRLSYFHPDLICWEL